MKFYRINSARDALFEEAFALYEISFPLHEQRPLEKQIALMPNPLYHFDVILEDEVFAGILLYWEGSDYVYVEHFAILPSRRGKAMGSRVLSRFCEKHPFVILEIDPLLDETALRRERFYQHIGFHTNGYEHTHPAYRKEFPPHELLVMSFPETMGQEMYHLFKRELDNIVMKDNHS